MAMGGAWVLADELRKLNGGPVEALKKHHLRLRSEIKNIRKMERRSPKMVGAYGKLMDARLPDSLCDYIVSLAWISSTATRRTLAKKRLQGFAVTAPSLAVVEVGMMTIVASTSAFYVFL